MKNLIIDKTNPSNNIWIGTNETLEPGDRISYVFLDEERIELLVNPEPSYGSCSGCYFGDAISCSEFDSFECNKYNVVFKRMDTNDILMIDEFYIKFNTIKRSLCNEDTCPYYENECNKYKMDGSSCLLRKIVDNHVHDE